MATKEEMASGELFHEYTNTTTLQSLGTASEMPAPRRALGENRKVALLSDNFWELRHFKNKEITVRRELDHSWSFLTTPYPKLSFLSTARGSGNIAMSLRTKKCFS